MSENLRNEDRTSVNPENQKQARSLSRRRILIGSASVAGVAVTTIALRTQANTQKPPTPQTGAAKSQGRFTNKVVLITGATSGIGEGTAYAFAREGAKVFFCGRRENLGRQVEANIRGFGGEATYMQADVRREEDVRSFVEACVRKYGRLDIAFNNAGIATPKNVPIAEQPTADWLDVITTNATGVFLSMKYELPYILQNQPMGTFATRGIIINNASVSGHVGFARITPYSASKHAIVGMTRGAAIEYGPQGVRINSISPGGVDTPMRRQAYIAQGNDPNQPLPTVPNFQRRVNTVEEIANAVLFIVSDEASSILGTDIDVTGGMLTGADFTQARS